MKWLSKKQLLNLLGESEQANVCLRDTDGNLSAYATAGAIPLSETLEIYERRFAHTQEREIEILGFPELMLALKSENDDRIKVHTFSGEKYDFIVFTDRKVVRLIGILQFQLNNAVNIDPATFRRPPGRPARN